MRFRVTSITGGGQIGELVRGVSVRLQDWLNASLADGDFGSGLDQITIFIVAVYDDQVENERWVTPRNKLGRYKDPVTGDPSGDLSIAVGFLPSELEPCSFSDALHTISGALMTKVSVRPKRVPKGFEYERCRKAMVAALSAHARA